VVSEDRRKDGKEKSQKMTKLRNLKGEDVTPETVYGNDAGPKKITPIQTKRAQRFFQAKPGTEGDLRKRGKKPKYSRGRGIECHGKRTGGQRSNADHQNVPGTGSDVHPLG